MSVVWVGTLGSLAAGLATGLGALGIFAVRELSGRMRDLMLGFAAGVMLAATFFSLLQPALEAAAGRGLSDIRAVLIVAGGVTLGALALAALHALLPHEHLLGPGRIQREGPAAVELRRIWLFVIAITLHNLPEGMAVGVGFGTGDTARGMALAIGIGAQNIPEGLAVAAALAAIGYRRRTAFWIALATGLVEPLGGFVGAAAVSAASSLLPWALGFAAGAMLFVISGEIIPETHRADSAKQATFALLAGFVLMMVLDVSLPSGGATRWS
jgi:zinc transporter, ZIP family